MEVVSLDRYEKQIQQGRRAGLMGAIQIGMALEAINSGNLWLNTGAKSFQAYVSCTHGFSKSTAHNMMGVAKAFGKYLIADPSLQNVEVTRLIRLLPLITDENREELLHTAATIPGSKAWDDTLRNLAGKTATDECTEHEWVTIKRCKICGQRVQE